MADKTFDIAAWLDQTSLPEGEVTIYGDAQALSQLKRDDLTADARAACQERVEASALTIRLRALTDAQRVALDKSHPRPSDDDPDELEAWDSAYAADLVAQMSIEPALTAAQVADIRERITPSTFAEIMACAGDVNRQNSADAPFWRKPSGRPQG